MLNPTLRKPQFNWKPLTTKPVLFASGSILTAFTLFAFVQGDRVQRLVIATASTPAIASFFILGHHKGKIDQLNHSKQQAEQQLQEKQKELQQLKGVLKYKEQTYQAREASLTQQNNQLLERNEDLEQQLQDHQQELFQLQFKLTQQKQAYNNLQHTYQQMENWFTEQNDELLQSKNELEQNFKQQETAYIQEIEKLEHNNQQLEQNCIQLEAKIQQLHQENNALKIAKETKLSNKNPSQSPSFEDLKVALIGGHPRACERAQNELENEYGFQECHIIPNDDNKISVNRIESKLKETDQIFIITGYNQHTLSKKVNELKNTGKLKGTIIYITKRGSRGMVKAIVEQNQLFS